ncbi:MAG TPA: DUF4835 family protein [Prolixibacteraceae bacterium]|nr:DUF4835 family protein [Prolixibacteraceae bacterium]
MRRIYLIIFLLIAFKGMISAQELRCNISISSSSLQNVNRNLFETMQSDLYEFMNNRKWTDEKYMMDERIECSIFINLTEQLSSNEYKGTIQVQARRPVFGSSYETTLLNLKDNDFQAKYIEYQTIEFNETSNKDNLTNILAFYAYLILGIDHDSFSPEGGTEFFQKAQAIVNNSQSAVEKGWKSYESERNRYWLIENIMNKSYSGYRSCMYQYHRQGLDVMGDKVAEGRASIAEALKLIQKVFRTRPSLYLLQVFFDAKSDELVNVFTKSFPDERNRVVTILNECDPSNGTKYEKISKAEGF